VSLKAGVSAPVFCFFRRFEALQGWQQTHSGGVALCPIHTMEPCGIENATPAIDLQTRPFLDDEEFPISI
jgi:hypothetical protein